MRLVVLADNVRLPAAGSVGHLVLVLLSLRRSWLPGAPRARAGLEASVVGGESGFAQAAGGEL